MHLTLKQLLIWIKTSRRRAFLLLVALILSIGMADVLTGPSYSMSLFYILPVILATRVFGRNVTIVVTLICAAIWTFSELLAGRPFTSWVEPSWNLAMRMGTLAIVVYLIFALEEEAEHAREDALTKLYNRREFLRLIENEENRAKRSGKPFSVLYLDIDNFKPLNDKFGHTVGDLALRVIASTLRQSARSFDIPARIGGDEFVVLLPGTGEAEREIVAKRITEDLQGAIQRRGWPISVSIGAVTMKGEMADAEKALTAADEAMYLVKQQRRKSQR